MHATLASRCGLSAELATAASSAQMDMVDEGKVQYSLLKSGACGSVTPRRFGAGGGGGVRGRGGGRGNGEEGFRGTTRIRPLLPSFCVMSSDAEEHNY